MGARQPGNVGQTPIEDKFRGFLDLVPDAVVITNAKGHIVLANTQTQTLFGYAPGEIVGRPVEVLMPLRYRRKHGTLRKQFLMAPRMRPMGAGLELYGLRKDGAEFPVEISLSPLESEAGPLVLCVMRDVTERKLGEQRLRSSEKNLRALAMRLQSVREEEQTRIAREIHDELGQRLTGLKMDLTWLAGKLQKDQKPLTEKAQAMAALIDATIQSVRRIAAGLRPQVLDDMDLSAAIAWQAQEFQLRTRVDVLTRLHDDCFVLEVNDNGRGIAEADVNSAKSLGLLGMRERVLPFGGTLEMKSGPNGGTRVVVSIPLERTENGEDEHAGAADLGSA
jgi:PAS domain S-box-containing protein